MQHHGSFIYQISCLGIIFIVMEQTISGALQGLGKILVPAIALAVGVVVKLLLNCYLVPINPEVFLLGGTAGAAIATVICHVVAFGIELQILKRQIALKLNITKFCIKPVIATIIMGASSYFSYLFFIQRVGEKLALMVALGIAVLVYGIFIILLQVFSKEEICMIPFGKKLCALSIWKEK